MTTKDEIIQLAKQVKMISTCYDGVPLGPHPDYIIDFANLIAARAKAEEREACAKVCEEHAANKEPPYKDFEDTYLDGWLDASNECGWAIRARNGETES